MARARDASVTYGQLIELLTTAGDCQERYGMTMLEMHRRNMRAHVGPRHLVPSAALLQRDGMRPRSWAAPRRWRMACSTQAVLWHHAPHRKRPVAA